MMHLQCPFGGVLSEMHEEVCGLIDEFPGALSIRLAVHSENAVVILAIASGDPLMPQKR
jgi:hypothetical protein